MQYREDVLDRISQISSSQINPQGIDSKIDRNSCLWRSDCRSGGGSPGFRVAILGAAGGIGQPLAMLMKMNPLVSLLHLYDVANSPGVTADISHMDTTCMVRGFLEDSCLRGLRGDADVVECAFVASHVTELPFFASKVRLGRYGVEEIYPLGPLNEYERMGLEKAKKELSGSINKGISFIKN